MFSCEQISVSSLPSSLSPPVASLSPPLASLSPPLASVDPVAPVGMPSAHHHALPGRYDAHLIASMQATTAYLLERVSMLEMRLLHQQDMITQFKKDHETYAHILQKNIDPPARSDIEEPLIHVTSVTSESDAIKRRKAVF